MCSYRHKTFQLLLLHSFFSSSFSPPPAPASVPAPPPPWFLPKLRNLFRCSFHSSQDARGTSNFTLTTLEINFWSFVMIVAFTSRDGAPFKSGISTSTENSGVPDFSISFIATVVDFGIAEPMVVSVLGFSPIHHWPYNSKSSVFGTAM